MMMTLVNMDSEGLHILPTHRVVHGLAAFDPGAFTTKAQAVFSRVDQLDTDSRNISTLLGELARAGEKAGSGATAMMAVLQDRVLALTMDDQARASALPDLPERKRQLDMVVLHEAILKNLLGITPEQVQAGEHGSYQRDAGEAVAAVLRGDVQIAFLVNPVTLAQLRENTFAGDVMPQKSTDFYPKLLSGLAIYALDGQEGGR